MRKWTRALLLSGLMAVLMGLSGCIFEPVDKLFALPALPEQYSQLQETIQTTIDELGAEYATINYGSNTSTVQLLDMDGDGAQETAAVFLRVSSNNTEGKSMRVCLFRRGSDEVYRLAYMVEGDGTSINSVAYEDITGDGARELIVSWQMSAKLHVLTVHSLEVSGAIELMNTTYNEGYQITDLNRDGKQEIIVFQQDGTGESSNRAEYYECLDGMMTMTTTVPLSASMRDVTSTAVSRLSDGKLGVYVTSEYDDGMLTDILVLRDDGLQNVTLDPESGNSIATARSYTEVGAADINKDGVMEIPMPVQAASLIPEEESSQYIIYWRQFDSSGNAATSCVTYHSVSDGWYLMLPNNWAGNITVSRDDSLSSRGERAVVFYYWPDMENSEPIPFFTVYRLTGNNRSARAKLSGRVTLYSDATTIYCRVLDESVWDYGVSAEDLDQRFNIITTEWSSQ